MSFMSKFSKLQTRAHLLKGLDKNSHLLMTKCCCRLCAIFAMIVEPLWYVFIVISLCLGVPRWLVEIFSFSIHACPDCCSGPVNGGSVSLWWRFECTDHLSFLQPPSIVMASDVPTFFFQPAQSPWHFSNRNQESQKPCAPHVSILPSSSSAFETVTHDVAESLPQSTMFTRKRALISVQ
jgi:hypothetical protein